MKAILKIYQDTKKPKVSLIKVVLGLLLFSISFVSVSASPSAQVGWPYNIGSYSLTSPNVAELDGNTLNGLEIVVGRTLFHSTAALYAFYSNNASFLYKDVYESIESAPAIGDIDMDGKLEVVVGGKNGGVYSWKNDNSLDFQTSVGGAITSSPSLANLDGNLSNGREVIVATWSGSIYVLYSNGTLAWSKGTGNGIKSSPAVGDIDGDGDLEVLVGSYDYKLHAWHHDGAVVEGFPVQTGNFIYSSPALGDINNDNELEIVVLSDDGKLYAWHRNGSNVSGFPVAGIGVTGSSPALADIDSDGNVEIVVGGTSSVFVISSNGSVKGNFPTNGSIGSSPALGDLDGDNLTDIVVGCEDSKVYAWSSNGSTIDGFPAAVDAPVSASPAIVDLDVDGDTEVVVTTTGGKIYVWDLPGGYNSSNILWKMFRHDSSHTGSYSPIVLISSPRVVNIESAKQNVSYYINLSQANIFKLNQNITFNSSVESGNIVSYNWSSDKDGFLSSSPSFVKNLSFGTHNITLTVRADNDVVSVARAKAYVYNNSVTFAGGSNFFNVSSNGIINITPANENVGKHYVNVTLSDGGTFIGYMNFTLGVYNINDPPTINTTNPSNFTNQGSLWKYDFNVSDPDLGLDSRYGGGDSLTWSSNVTIVPATGVATWVPNNSQVGNNTIRVTVADAYGANYTLNFLVYVNNTNDPPTLLPIGNQYAVVNYSSCFDVNATDPDINYGDTLTFSDNTLLFDINSSTGRICLTASDAAVGTHEIMITVTDAAAVSDSKLFNLTVDYDAILLTAYSDKSNYYQNENATVIAEITNLLGNRTNVGTVWAEFTKPCGSEILYLNNTGVGLYEGRIENLFVSGWYNFTVHAERVGYPSNITNVSFAVYPPANWSYNMNVTVGAGAENRSNATVEIQVNFTEKLKNFGGGIFDINSIRIYETDAAGTILREVPSLIEENPGTVNISEDLALQAKGATATASTYYSTLVPSKAIDGINNTNTGWASAAAPGGIPAWLKVDLGGVKNIGRIAWQHYSTSYKNTDYIISVSQDCGSYSMIPGGNVTGNSNFTVEYKYFGLVKCILLNISKVQSTYATVGEMWVNPLIYSYNSSNNALVNLTWIMDGSTTAGATRYYQIRFDTTGNSKYGPGYANASYANNTVVTGLVISIYNASNNTAPTAIAVVNSTMLRNVAYTFNGSNSSDPNGDALVYYWNFGDCSGGIGREINHTYIANTMQQLGAKNVTLTVYDGKGGCGNALNSASVINQPPVLNVENMSAYEDQLFIYDVNATDYDTLNFSAVTNMSKVSINSSTGIISFLPNNSDVGNYSVNISAFDGLVVGYKEVNLEVVNINDPPVLEFFTGQTIEENKTLLIYVNATDDDLIHGDNLTFSTNSTLVNISKISSTTGLVNWTPTNVNVTYTEWVNFAVTDNNGSSSSWVIPITVLNTINEPPVVDKLEPEDGTKINEAETLNITIKAHDPNGGAPTIIIRLYNKTGLVNYTVGEGLNYSWVTTYDDSGNYTFTVEVTDGLNTTIINRTYIVLNVNRPPTITIISPENNSNFSEGETFYITFNATDADGDAFNYSIKLDGTEISTSNNISYTWNYTSAGSHFINASAADSNGGVGSSLISVNVFEPDISISSSDITFSSDKPVDGKAVTIIATVRNLGNASTKPLEVSFYKGGVGEESIGNATVTLGANSSSNASVSWIPDYGNQTITVYVNPNQIAPNYESNNSNNNASTIVRIWGKPDLTISANNITFSEPIGGNVTVNATVNNLNESDANFNTELRVDGILHSKNAMFVSNFSSNSTIFIWKPSNGLHELTIIADPENAVNEGNESNNEAVVKLGVLGGVVDLVPPTINITSPGNTTYEWGTPIKISYANTSSDVLSDDWYALDSGANTSFINGTTTITPEVGSHSITIWVNESSGNWGSDTEYFTIVDTVPPAINLPSDITVPKGSSKSLFWTITEPYPDTYIISRNGTEVQRGSYANGTPVGIDVNTSTIGNWNYTILANDTSGNSAQDEVIVNVKAVYGVSLGVDALSKAVLENQDVNFTFTIVNTGNWQDSYNISVSNTSDIATLSKTTTGSLGSGATDGFVLTMKDSASGTYTATITVKSNGDASKSGSVTVTLTVTQVPTYGVSLSVNTSSISVEQNENATYIFTVKNTGNQNDTIAISSTASSILVTTSLNRTSAQLAPGGSINVALNVSSSTIGKDYLVKVSATSATNPALSKSLDTKTTVIGALSFSVEPKSKAVYTNVDATYSLTVNNTGTKTHTYNFGLTKPSSASASLNQTSITLAKGGSAVVLLNVGSATAGTYVVYVNATDAGESIKQATVTTTTYVNVVPVYGVAVFASPESRSVNPNVDAVYTITILNTGNQEDNYTFFVNAPTGDTATLSGASNVTLASGASTAKNLTVKSGRSGEHLAKVTAVSQTDQSKSSSVTVTTFVKSYGVVLTSDGTSAVTKVGNLTSFTLTIKNTGNALDSYDIALENLGGYSQANLSSTTVSGLVPGSTSTVIVTVANNTAGKGIIRVNATSQSNNTAKANINLSIEMQQPDFNGIELAATPLATYVERNENAIYTLTIKNTGNVNDTVTLTTTAGNLSSSSISLAAGESKTAFLTANSTTFKTHNITIVARSSNTSVSANTTVYFTVKEALAITATPASQSLFTDNAAIYKITIENTGTKSHSYYLSVFGNTTYAVLGATTTPSIEPGKTETVELLVNSSTSGMYQANVRASVQGEPDKNKNTTVRALYLGSLTPVYGLSIIPDVESQTTTSGKNALFLLTVVNLGNQNDIINLSITQDGTGGASLSSASLTLNPRGNVGDTNVVKLTASSTIVGEYTINVIANSTGKNTVSGTVTLKLRIAEQSGNNIVNSEIDPLSTISNSNVTNSIVENSLLNKSAVNASKVSASSIHNSTVIDSSIESLILKNAYVVKNVIFYGNITIEGLEYAISSSTYPNGVTISEISTSKDAETNSVAGENGSVTTIDAEKGNIQLKIGNEDNYVGGTVVMHRSTVPPAGIGKLSAQNTNEVDGYVNIEASANVEEAINWTIINITYSREKAAQRGVSDSAITIFWHNESSGQWVSLQGAGNPDFVLGAGRGIISNELGYVWVNVTHFSVYGIGGSITSTTTPATGGGGGYTPEAVALANSIDLYLANDFLKFIRDHGISVTYASASNFSKYKNKKSIIILGGPDAYEGVGEIVKEVLSEDERVEVRTNGSKKMYDKNSIWVVDQKVIVIAGSDRNYTNKAWGEYKSEAVKRIK